MAKQITRLSLSKMLSFLFSEGTILEITVNESLILQRLTVKKIFLFC